MTSLQRNKLSKDKYENRRNWKRTILKMDNLKKDKPEQKRNGKGQF